jgi:hypothetical protein
VILDAYGNVVPTSQETYLAVHDMSGGFLGGDKWLPNPEYQAPAPATAPTAPTISGAPPSLPTQNINLAPGPAPLATPTKAPVPAQTRFTFDTIGQEIYRSIGDVRLPARIIWLNGITTYGQSVLANTTISFAAALCAPFDPAEELFVAAVMLGGEIIFDSQTGVIVPPTLTDPTVIAQMTAALGGMIVYRGTEGQLPDPSILADRGVAVTPAFRGMRYVVVPDWPVALPLNNMSFIFTRTSPGAQGQAPTSVAVCGIGNEPQPLGVPYAAGDGSCSTYYSPDGKTWYCFGANILGSGGSVFCGISAKVGGFDVYLMAGDNGDGPRGECANYKTATALPLLGDWSGSIFNPILPSPSDIDALSFDPASSTIYALVDYRTSTNQQPNQLLFRIYRSIDGVNYTGFEDYLGDPSDGPGLLITTYSRIKSLGSVWATLPTTRGVVPNENSLTPFSASQLGILGPVSAVGQFRGQTITVTIDYSPSAIITFSDTGYSIGKLMVQVGSGTPTWSGIYSQSIFYGNGRFTSLIQHESTLGNYSDDGGATWPSADFIFFGFPRGATTSIVQQQQ